MVQLEMLLDLLIGTQLRVHINPQQFPFPLGLRQVQPSRRISPLLGPPVKSCSPLVERGGSFDSSRILALIEVFSIAGPII